VVLTASVASLTFIAQELAMNPSLMPTAFIGHGSPVNTIDDNKYTRAWRAFATAAPRPRGVLVISAHWYTSVTAVTAMARPRTIHDLFGFGERLQTFQYPCPGSPQIADEIRALIAPHDLGLDDDAWGIDHGAWSVLAHMFPAADVPVLQLSINATKDFAYHMDLGASLSPLRERGILIVASGNTVHNLGRIDPSMQDRGFDWAERFDAATTALVTARPSETASLADHADYRNAAPTPDHFIPLLYFAALAHAAGRVPRVLVDGCALGSVSMTSYALDV
jgi:4,5-DOPA dioxygenase extradiol